MAKQGNEYLLDAEDLKTLAAAEELLKKMYDAEEVSWKSWPGFPIRDALTALRIVLHPQSQGEDEVEYARRIA
jgi:hypothetical protein